MKYDNVYFINGTAYAGKSTMVKLLAAKYNGIACEENYHNQLSADLDSQEFPGLTYTRDLQNWSEFIRRTPDEYEAISDKNHVLIMLAEPDISVKRFFERPDKEKQFLYQLLLQEENPDEAMENFRECLKRVNSEEIYHIFLNSGFKVILRDEKRKVDETLSLVEDAFRLRI